MFLSKPVVKEQFWTQNLNYRTDSLVSWIFKSILWQVINLILWSSVLTIKWAKERESFAVVVDIVGLSTS